VGIAPLGTTSFTRLKGLQSVGVNTKFNLAQAFEIGQLALYQHIEDLPDVEVTLEKVLDGSPLIGHLATYGAPDGSLVGRSNQRCMLGLSLYTDTQSSASGTPLSQCTVSGAYLSAWNFSFSVDATSTESATLVANNKTWLTSAFTFTPTYPGNEAPVATEGVDRRWHVLMGNCRFPTDVPGISSSGTNDPSPDGTGFTVAFQSAKFGVNLGRDNLNELGQRGPYFRYVNFPVEVKSDFEMIAKSGDLVTATEQGTNAHGGNLSEQHIFFQTQEGTKIDCGTHNMLTSVNYGGANAGSRGGNAHVTMSYQTFNEFTVQHPADPTTGLAG
jgi:hypothetical protein